MEDKKKTWEDKAKEFLVSKKLLAFLVSTGLLIAGIISEQLWSYVTMVFMGAEALQKFAPVLSGISSILRGEKDGEPKKDSVVAKD